MSRPFVARFSTAIEFPDCQPWSLSFVCKAIVSIPLEEIRELLGVLPDSPEHGKHGTMVSWSPQQVYMMLIRAMISSELISWSSTSSWSNMSHICIRHSSSTTPTLLSLDHSPGSKGCKMRTMIFGIRYAAVFVPRNTDSLLESI